MNENQGAWGQGKKKKIFKMIFKLVYICHTWYWVIKDIFIHRLIKHIPITPTLSNSYSSHWSSLFPRQIRLQFVIDTHVILYIWVKLESTTIIIHIICVSETDFICLIWLVLFASRFLQSTWCHSSLVLKSHCEYMLNMLNFIYSLLCWWLVPVFRSCEIV